MEDTENEVQDTNLETATIQAHENTVVKSFKAEQTMTLEEITDFIIGLDIKLAASSQDDMSKISESFGSCSKYFV